MTAHEILTLRPQSPLRSPAWRWELARHLRGGLRVSGAAADVHVTDAVTFQDALENAGGGHAELGELFLAGADAADAYLFWSTGEVADVTGGTVKGAAAAPGGPLSAQALARAELEALILADRPPARIGKVCGLTEAAVVAYERWFFDVRDRLSRAGWISANVIGSLFANSPVVLLPSLIRAYGYYTKSVRVVRTLVGGFDQAISRRAGRDPGRFFGADAVTAGGLKAALAVRMMDVTEPKTFGRIIELHNEAVSAEAKLAGSAGGGSESEDKYKEAFAALRGKIEYGYQEPPVDTYTPPGPRLVVADDPEARTG